MPKLLDVVPVVSIATGVEVYRVEITKELKTRWVCQIVGATWRAGRVRFCKDDLTLIPQYERDPRKMSP